MNSVFSRYRLTELISHLIIFWCALFLCPALVEAAELSHYDVRIVVTEVNEQTKPIIEALQKKYQTAQVMSETASTAKKKKKTIYIAIGPSAFRTLLTKDPEGAIFSVFVSSQAYYTIAQGAAKSHNAMTAIYADPAPLAQLRLVSLLYKRRVPVVTLVSDKTSHLIPALNQAAAKADVDLSIQSVAADDNLNRILNRIDPVPAVLAIPDSTVFNNDNIRNILVTTYRSNQSLIGFSTSMVKAGALATTYSSIDDIVAQLAETIDEFDASGRMPEPQFPKYFSTIINDNVARSLNIVIDDSARNFSRKPAAR
jgi:hypothetical protein